MQKHHWKSLCTRRASDSASGGFEMDTAGSSVSSFWAANGDKSPKDLSYKGPQVERCILGSQGLVSRARATKLLYPKKDPVLQTFLIFWGQNTGSKFLPKVCQSVQTASGPSRETPAGKPAESPQHNLSNPSLINCPHPLASKTNYLQNLPFRESPALYSKPRPGQISWGPSF